MANYSWTYLIFLGGCWDAKPNVAPEEPSKLMEASHQVIFASVEKIGIHSFQATYQQTEFHGEDIRSEHEEVLEISWQNWDNFESKRTVDGEIVSNIIITDAQTWDWQSQQWVRRRDGEPYRVQLRNTWNQWDSVMRHFGEHVEWILDGDEVIEGRKTKRYRALFTKPERVKVSLRPIEFQGMVWVDEETAVRILGEISGVLLRDAYKKQVKYQVQRTEIGLKKDISPPI